MTLFSPSTLSGLHYHSHAGLNSYSILRFTFKWYNLPGRAGGGGIGAGEQMRPISARSLLKGGGVARCDQMTPTQGHITHSKGNL